MRSDETQDDALTSKLALDDVLCSRRRLIVDRVGHKHMSDLVREIISWTLSDQ